MELKETVTIRGFPRIEFKDWYGKDCTIQISSLADEQCIWFGPNGNRMHLSMAQVEALLPILEKFAKTGEI